MRVSLFPNSLDLAPAKEILDAPLWRLFRAMPPGDQWHGLCVLRRLLARGYDGQDLLAAALLHDVGKAHGGLTLAHRTLIVLADALKTDWVARLAKEDADSWRHPFYLHRHHAERGASLLQAAGASELLVRLVRAHERDSELLPAELQPLQQALIAADDAC